MNSLQVAARTAAWALVALVVAAMLSAPGGPLGPGLAQAADALVLTGDVEGLVPGQATLLRVALANGGASEVTVATVSASVSGGAPTCTLDVLPWTGTLTVPAGGSVQVDLALTVADRPECAGQSWQLEYAAS